MRFCDARYHIDGDFDGYTSCVRRHHLFGWHEAPLSLTRWGTTFTSTIRWRQSWWMFRSPPGVDVEWATLLANRDFINSHSIHHRHGRTTYTRRAAATPKGDADG